MLSRLALTAATVAGKTLALVVRATPYLPGAVGAVCVTAGLGMVFAPLGWITAGGFLLLLDREIR